MVEQSLIIYICVIVSNLVTMLIEFGHFGKHLSTRLAGSEVREKIAQTIERNEKVIFDFTGVEIITNSFADECFAKLTLKFDLPFVKAHTTFRNATPFIKGVIANSFKERLHQLHSA